MSTEEIVAHARGDALSTLFLGFVIVYAIAVTLWVAAAYWPDGVRILIARVGRVRVPLGDWQGASKNPVGGRENEIATRPLAAPLPAVVHVIPAEVFDFAHARRVRELWLAEQVFKTTTWGEDGRVN